MNKKLKHTLGQYMTPPFMAQFMISLTSKDQSASVLEPSCGQGIFVQELRNRGFKQITALEVDQNFYSEQNKFINQSFVTAQFAKKFDLIIGNPPYIRWKNLDQNLKDELQTNQLWNSLCNSLCDYSYIFILKAIELLNDGGELIFITPEYWLNTTHSQPLRDYMLSQGELEQLVYFNEVPIFENASIATIVFKFIKTKNSVAKNMIIKKIKKEVTRISKIDESIFNHSQSRPFKIGKPWIGIESEIESYLSRYESRCIDRHNIKIYLRDICDIANGMVSGLDQAFQIDKSDLNQLEANSLIKVVKAKNLKKYIYDKVTDYFFITEKIISEIAFKELYPSFAAHLEKFKPDLNKRYQYKREIPYWEWVFPRSYKLFMSDRQRIGVPCKERISHKSYFRFALLPNDVVTTQDVTAIFVKPEVEESIYYVLALLNSNYIFEWLKYNGIVKGEIVEFSERPLAGIPFLKINFNSSSECTIYDAIVNLTKKYLVSQELSLLEQINLEFEKLLVKSDFQA